MIDINNRIIQFCIVYTLALSFVISAESNERPQILWRVPISHDGDVNGLIPLSIYKSGILCLGRNQQSPILHMKEQNTGKNLWSWRDTTWNNLSSVRTNAYHIYQNILVFQHSSKTYYINLNNGKLIREIAHKQTSTNTVVGAKSFYCFAAYSRSWCNFYAGNIKTGKEQMLVSMQITKKGESVYPQTPKFVEYNNDLLLLLPFRRYDESLFLDQGFVTLYNFSRKKNIYTIPVNEISQYEAIQEPLVVNKKIYMTVGFSIVCHNLITGKQLWRTKLPGDFMSSGIIYADGKIIGNCEDTNMYALDPENGKILWREKTAGTSRTPFYMNGVAYLAGNGDGLLHAVDTKIGEHLWRVICPEKGDDSSFFGYVTGANGKIFVCSFSTLYCFKAAR